MNAEIGYFTGKITVENSERISWASYPTDQDTKGGIRT